MRAPRAAWVGSLAWLLAIGARASEPPVLGLDEAVAVALAHNRLLQTAELDVAKHTDRRNALRTRRLPSLRVAVLGARLLTPLDFRFPMGSFGTFPTTGPIPPANTTITTPVQFSAFLVAGAAQPLTQQYRIGLGLELEALSERLAREVARRQRHEIASQVRRAYLDLATTLAAEAAAQDLVQTLREADALTERYVAQQLALPADAIRVKSRLADANYELLRAQNGLCSQREHLNVLLGRDLDTPFRVEEPSPEPAGPTFTLEEARAQALRARPELLEAELRAEQADADLRLARAEYVPDLSLVGGYVGAFHVDVLPTHAAAVGLFLDWEVFDWGRKGAAVDERRRTIEQARLALDEARDQVRTEVGLRFRQAQEAGLRLASTRLALQASRESLQVAANRYREQATLLRDLLQAETQLSSALHDQQQALAGYWTARAELEKAVGHE